MNRRLLAALVALRLAFPLAVLVFEGRDLPLVRRWDYVPLAGDAHAYVTTARELHGAAARVAPFLALAVVVAAAVALFALRRARAPWRLPVLVLAMSCAAAVPVLAIERAAAGALGWPLVLSPALLAERAAGLTGDDAAFAAGLLLGLAAQAVAVVAVGYAAFRLTGSAQAGHGAAALAAIWPLLLALAVDPEADENHTVAVATGLALYTEPLSGALIAAGIVLVLGGSRTDAAAAGVVLAFAALTRQPNALVGVAALVFVALRRPPSHAAAFAAGALALAPLAVAFEVQETAYEPESVGAALEATHVVPAFAHSTVHGVAFAAALVLALGAWSLLRSAEATFLLAAVAAVVAFYATFASTPEHPRYFLAAVPPFLVLVAAGAHRAAARAVRTS